MKTQSNFRIKHCEYFDEKGNLLDMYYYIQEWKKFLWWSYWEDIKHETCEYGDRYKKRTTFNTIEEAKDFVRNILCPELPRQSCIENVVDEMVYKNAESKW